MNTTCKKCKGKGEILNKEGEPEECPKCEGHGLGMIDFQNMEFGESTDSEDFDEDIDDEEE